MLVGFKLISVMMVIFLLIILFFIIVGSSIIIEIKFYLVLKGYDLNDILILCIVIYSLNWFVLIMCFVLLIMKFKMVLWKIIICFFFYWKFYFRGWGVYLLLVLFSFVSWFYRGGIFFLLGFGVFVVDLEVIGCCFLASLFFFLDYCFFEKMFLRCNI